MPVDLGGLGNQERFHIDAITAYVLRINENHVFERNTSDKKDIFDSGWNALLII